MGSSQQTTQQRCRHSSPCHQQPPARSHRKVDFPRISRVKTDSLLPIRAGQDEMPQFWLIWPPIQLLRIVICGCQPRDMRKSLKIAAWMTTARERPTMVSAIFYTQISRKGGNSCEMLPSYVPQRGDTHGSAASRTNQQKAPSEAAGPEATTTSHHLRPKLLWKLACHDLVRICADAHCEHSGIRRASVQLIPMTGIELLPTESAEELTSQTPDLS